ncbi:MAG: DNA-binding response regulator [Bacteroidetes bacterium]|jgi:DNA-binding NarL/FixJ family response regulator|nr:DNA-binding response regulator [Bacteroidota bacterium]
MTIKVAIVEDNKKIREGLAILIDGSEGFQCSAVYDSAEEALRHLPSYKPDVVLMDIQLPGMSGIECVAKLKEKNPNLQVIMLTVFEDDEKVFKSIVAGATGYILKRTPAAELLGAIKEVHEGGSPMSDQIARKVVQAFQQMGKSSKETENLTEREMEILSFLAKGYQDQEIADQFFISVKTVRTHLRNTYQKLHVRSRTQAVLKYLRK